MGVKVDKKTVADRSGEMTLMLWDIYGQDEFQTVRDSYLRGTSGLSARRRRHPVRDARYRDGATAKAESYAGAFPFLLLLNKADLEADWQVMSARCGSSPIRGGMC